MMTPIQLPIKNIGDIAPMCPVCKQHTGILGQAYPIRDIYVCRGCTQRLAINLKAFVMGKDGSVSLRDTVDDASMWGERARLMTVIAILKRFAGGCALTVDDIAEDMHLPCGNRQRCRKCKNEARYTATILANARTHIANRNAPMYRMVAFPLCLRCGQMHGRVIEFNGLPTTYCQQCDDELAVEGFYRGRAIWGGADDESILDRLYKSMPRLFEHGVLPNYWYVLRQKEERK